MLSQHPVDVMLLATDLGVAREFYADRVGLKVLIQTEEFLSFQCGGDSRLVVTCGTTVTKEPQTKANWRVGDLAAELDALRARGVVIEDYDEPGLTTVDGIADIGFALAAWFIDPHRNTIGLMQFKRDQP